MELMAKKYRKKMVTVTDFLFKKLNNRKVGK